MTAVTLVFIISLVALLDVDIPALATAQSENDLTQAPIGDKQNSKDRGEQYAHFLEAQFELEWIQEVLQDPEKLLSEAEIESANMSKDRLLKELGVREAELERTVKRLASAAPEYQNSSTDASAQRPFQIQTEVPLEFNNEKLKTLAEAQQMPGCALSFGQVRASTFFEYQWQRPTPPGWGGTAFWPLPQSDQLPQQTFTGNWTGSTGAYFWQFLDVPGNWPSHPQKFLGTAAVFRFSIPAPGCDSIIYWGTRAVVEAPTDWQLTGRSRITSEWVLQENARGGPFPFTILDFIFISEGLFQHTNEPDRTVKKRVTPINRSFGVAAGNSPNIYLGISMQSIASNGVTSTKSRPRDYFEFGNGITYVMVPN